ncbi:MAG: hypothetical protein IKJ42_09075 [Bacteroidaceae bacterium]|nr:hypothetical protein [Bacteroidaceae bacterium]
MNVNDFRRHPPHRTLRRKRLAEEFDRRLTEYFKRGREEVMKDVRE